MSCLTSSTPVVLPENELAATVWNSAGDHYDRISRQVADAIEHCVDRLGPKPGEQVLDVATGTGWAARRASARGADVTGVDICSTALETARSLDVSQKIHFQLGDAESLQWEDASFDAVLSTFGVMFCGAPEKAAEELARVCKPGGRLALAIWDTVGGVYDMFRILGKFKPKTSTPAPSPFAWASETRLKELLGDHFEFSVERAVSYYRDATAEAAWETFVTSYGPLKSLMKSLDATTAEQLQREFVNYHAGHATPLGILVPRDYLVVVGRRKS